MYDQITCVLRELFVFCLVFFLTIIEERQAVFRVAILLLNEIDEIELLIKNDKSFSITKTKLQNLVTNWNFGKKGHVHYITHQICKILAIVRKCACIVV